MNTFKYSIASILLASVMASISPVSAEENDSNNVPPMMNGYGMPMMGGQWSGHPMYDGQWRGQPGNSGQWHGMPMMSGQWHGQMMNDGWNGMPCYAGGNTQQLEQRLTNIEQKLDKLLARQKNK